MTAQREVDVGSTLLTAPERRDCDVRDRDRPAARDTPLGRGTDVCLSHRRLADAEARSLIGSSGF